MSSFAPRYGGIFETIRAEIDYASVVERHTKLTPEGGSGTLIGFCPLKEQKSGNPAFKVYPDGHAHCFSCGFHGDVVDYYQQIRRLGSPIEAARELVREFGITLAEADPEFIARFEQRRKAEDRFLEAAKENHARLDTDKSRRVREYLERRGFGSELCERLLLGMTPGGDVSIPYWNGPRPHGIIRRKLDGSETKYLYPKSEQMPLG